MEIITFMQVTYEYSVQANSYKYEGSLKIWGYVIQI
jgi:hypothetical protein